MNYIPRPIQAAIIENGVGAVRVQPELVAPTLEGICNALTAYTGDRVTAENLRGYSHAEMFFFAGPPSTVAKPIISTACSLHPLLLDAPTLTFVAPYRRRKGYNPNDLLNGNRWENLAKLVRPYNSQAEIDYMGAGWNEFHEGTAAPAAYCIMPLLSKEPFAELEASAPVGDGDLLRVLSKVFGGPFTEISPGLHAMNADGGQTHQQIAQGKPQTFVNPYENALSFEAMVGYETGHFPSPMAATASVLSAWSDALYYAVEHNMVEPEYADVLVEDLEVIIKLISTMMQAEPAIGEIEAPVLSDYQS